MGQHEPDQHQHHHEHQHDPEEAVHQAEAFAVTASILEAENETPERSSMAQVVATRSVTLTGVNSPRPLDFARDLDRDHLAGPAVTDDEEVDLVDGDALGVGLLLLGVEVDARFGRSGRDEVHGTGVNGQAHDCSFQKWEGTSLPLGRAAQKGQTEHHGGHGVAIGAHAGIGTPV